MKILRYQRADGSVPFTEWLGSIRDKVTQARIRIRLKRLSAGHLGDVKSIGDGVSELRLHFGPGYRVYLARSGSSWVILLCGGDKSTQRRDIATAKEYWRDWQERQE